MPSVVQVFIMKGGALEGTELVSSEQFVIGSGAMADVVLDDPSVGARHVGVFVHEGRLAVSDLGGPGGTQVGGAVIDAPRYVSPREDVVVGVYTLKLKLMAAAGADARGSTPPSAAPPPPPVLSAPPESPTVPSPPPLAPATLSNAVTAVLSPTFERSSLTQQHTLPEGRHKAPSSFDDTTIIDARQTPSAPKARIEALSPPTEQRELVDDEDADDDVPEPAWSLVEKLGATPELSAGQHAALEVVHCRGEVVVDHRLIRRGERFVLGAAWSADALVERGLTEPVPLAQLNADGRVELMNHPLVATRVGRRGAPLSSSTPSSSTTIADDEQATLSVGSDRLFVRFASVPSWASSPEHVQELRAARQLNLVAGLCAFVLLASLAAMSWLYGFRSKDVDVIELGDDGFADIVVKDLEFQEPPPEKKPERPPPVQITESSKPLPDTPTKQAEPTPKEPAKQASAPTTPSEAPKPTGLAAALSNIPKVNDSASSQNLNAALSNIKGVRVPGAQGDFKTSALTGKGPSAGVQIGGAAGGVATSGINSLIRKDGAAGSLGEKGDRAVAGKVTTQPRLSQVKGAGELSKDEIQRVINAHVGEIQYCYEKQLRGNSGLAGRVVLEWTVASTGAVSLVKVSTSSLSSTEATSCMMDRVKKWKFPKPRGNGGVTVVYPFVFNTI